MPSKVKYCYIGLLATMILANIFPVPVYLHMMVNTLLIIYIGSHQSVNAEDSLEGMERMSSKDAYMFPVIGSLFLFSLYLVFKFLPKEYVNIAVKGYFFLFGVVIVANNVHKLFNLILEKPTFDNLDKELFRCKIPFMGHQKKEEDSNDKSTSNVKQVKVVPDSNAKVVVEDEKVNPKHCSDGSTIFSVLDLACYFVAILVGAWYLAYNHWSANNVFGIFFSIQGIEFLSLGSFMNGCVLLCGLFVYDVFWVFGTDVMVTVAKSFDAPIKLLFPRDLGSSPSMLGLGDIVIPGIFIALLLRFDNSITPPGQTSRKWHFYTVMVGYFIGLSTTVGVMYHFQAAQPALLYLVPACLGTAFLGAAISGNVSKMVKFTEEGKDKKKTDAVVADAAAPSQTATTSSSSADATDESLTTSAGESSADEATLRPRPQRQRSRKDI